MFGPETELTGWASKLQGIVRILLALLYMQHGLSKYIGFPGPPPANFHAFSLLGLAGVIEIVGSLLVLVGLFTRPAAFIISGEMAVAYFMNRPPRGFFPLLNGGELEATYSLFFFTFFLIGAGEWSFDQLKYRRNRHI